jgi:hypothetical protein
LRKKERRATPGCRGSLAFAEAAGGLLVLGSESVITGWSDWHDGNQERQGQSLEEKHCFQGPDANRIIAIIVFRVKDIDETRHDADRITYAVGI